MPLTSLGQWEPSKVSTEAFYSYTFALFQVLIVLSFHHQNTALIPYIAALLPFIRGDVKCHHIMFKYYKFLIQIF